jgi:hypothetical protein
MPPFALESNASTRERFSGQVIVGVKLKATTYSGAVPGLWKSNRRLEASSRWIDPNTELGKLAKGSILGLEFRIPAIRVKAKACSRIPQPSRTRTRDNSKRYDISFLFVRPGNASHVTRRMQS